MKNFFDGVSCYYIQQIKEWLEIFTNFETVNKYEVLDGNGQRKGFVAELGGGLTHWLARIFLRSHRPFSIMVWEQNNQQIMSFKRPFYWFFSSLHVLDVAGKVIGHVERRFAFFSKCYDLTDERQEVFARIRSPFFRIWKFPIFDKTEREVGAITKNWGGMLKEMFTDADKFQVNFPNMDEKKKAIIFAAAISVDLDYFEDNNSRN